MAKITWTCGKSKQFRAGGVLVATAVVAIVLLTLQQLLKVPSGFGIEDTLGWTDPDAVVAIRELWAEAGLPSPWLGIAYLVLDTGVFMPLYGLALLVAWAKAQSMMALQQGWGLFFTRTGIVLVAVLLLVDLAENLVGIHRLVDTSSALAAVSVACLLVLAGTLFLESQQIDEPWLKEVLNVLFPGIGTKGVVLRIALVVAVVVALLGACSSSETCASESFALSWGCAAHEAKGWCVLAALCGPLGALLWKHYGTHGDRRKGVASRGAIVGVVWRSRYVLLALGACIALMLVMNQGRDVIYAMASYPWQGTDEGWRQTVKVAVMLVVLALTAMALWILGFNCWMWARLGIRVARAGDEGRERDLPENQFARYWARALGVVPGVLMFVLTLATLPYAVTLKEPWTITVLLTFAVVVLLGSVAFVWQREKFSHGTGKSATEITYYASMTLEQVVAASQNMKLFGLLGTRTIPLAALVLALLCRAVSTLAPPEWQVPSLSLPLVLCLVAFWLTFAGWISLYEHSESIPWFAVVVVWMGLLGAMGCSENHRVPLWDNAVAANPWLMVGFMMILGLLLYGAVWALMRCIEDVGSTKKSSGSPPENSPSPSPSPPPRIWIRFVSTVVVVTMVVWAGDRLMPTPPQSAKSEQQALSAPEALAAWLHGLCGLAESQSEASSKGEGCGSGRFKEAYIVAAEGGGIRSAYWTALALEQLSRKDGSFDARTFAMSGVSGGSVGLAVYRACRLQASMPAREGTREAPDQRFEKCIDRLGKADLLSPLLGAWFFEDAVARWIPTGWCERPGCGFLSRGLWLEAAMSKAVKELDTGVVRSHAELRDRSRAHVPYLLLNSTWVESGERAIASEIIIDPLFFPGARDGIAQLAGGSDLPLSTAAHNSARFPFTNALGAVHTTSARCSPDAFRQRAKGADTGKTEGCGHFADGGYFDNSGGQSVADVLRLLRACLTDAQEGDSSFFCPGVKKSRREALQKDLRMRVIMVRNGLVPSSSRGDGSDRCRRSIQPMGKDVRLPPQRMQHNGFDVYPQCAENASLFVDLFGPVITAVASVGTGSNGRLAAMRAGNETAAIAAIDTAGGAAPSSGDAKQGVPVIHVSYIDLLDDGPLFPLGWHLSPAAQKEMRTRAEGLRKPGSAGS